MCVVFATTDSGNSVPQLKTDYSFARHTMMLICALGSILRLNVTLQCSTDDLTG